MGQLDKTAKNGYLYEAFCQKDTFKVGKSLTDRFAR